MMRCFSRMLPAFLLAAGALSAPALSQAEIAERVSVGRDGLQSNGASSRTAVSGDGRYVAFASAATNLVSPDTNGAVMDVFVHDRVRDTTELVSVSSDGSQGTDSSSEPSVSADGRFVAFSSYSALTEDDTNGACDVYVRDRLSGTTELVSVGLSGESGSGDSDLPAISGDGRYVSFRSFAADLVPGDANGFADVFLRDLSAGSTERVSLDSAGAEANNDSFQSSLGTDGQLVAFSSYATNLIPGDTHWDQVTAVFVRDRQSGTTEMVTLTAAGAPAYLGGRSPSMHGSGMWVAFSSQADDLVENDLNGTVEDVFVRTLGYSTMLVSLGEGWTATDGASVDPVFSREGEFVAYRSWATNIVPDDTNGESDVFLMEFTSLISRRASLGDAGQEGSGYSLDPAVSNWGIVVAFSSQADNLVSGDTNQENDVFVSHGNDFDGDHDGSGAFEDCDDADPSVHPGAQEVKHDGIDQDCNGYDLTIDITTAEYLGDRDTLTVVAASSLGEGALLEVFSFGPMDWNAKKLRWERKERRVGSDPLTVVVCGIEGCESSPTGGGSGGQEGKGQTCADGVDNDADGLVDCADSGCSRNKSCR